MGIKVFRRLTLPFILALSMLFAFNPAVLAAEWEDYSDVSKDNAHYEGIKAMTEQEVFTGYKENEFHPWENLSRQHAAVILTRAENFEEPADIAKVLEIYSDVTSSSYYAKEIAAVTEAGVFTGQKDGKFDQSANLTRQQMASVLVRALNLDQYEAEKVNINLDNVNESHKDNVQILANLELTDQLEDFRPGEPITRAAIASLLHRAQSVGLFELSVMHMNDSHAHVEPLPQMVTAVKEVRQEKPDALMFHAGDAFSGTLYFNEFNGQADVELFNMMGMTAMAFGNHEFDRGDKEEGNKTLAEFVKAANFPFLGSNIDFSQDPFMKDIATNESLVKNAEAGKSYYSIVEEIDGEEIGIFGLDTEATANIARPNQVVFNDYLATAEEAVAEFEEAGIDKIIAVTHIGLDNDPKYGNDQLLAQMDGIDVIVGGHSHTEIHEPVVVTEDADGNEKDPTIIVQAGDKSRYLGTLDVQFDSNGVVVGHAGELLKVAEYEPDPDAAEVLKCYSDQIE